ncbi:MAG: Gfo/Idh/MocA family oxidoreductase [Verrucomicrobia bacterium]|nr:Gfo/Idh/MocA family oxidoreductase [Verrucomicrobiota bacterium]
MSAQNDNAGVNRRDFLKGSSFATLMTMLGGVRLFAQATPEAPAEPKPPGPAVKVGIIGLGPQGRDILDQLGRLPQEETHAEVTAICDTYAPMLRRSSSKAPGAAQVADYKAVLDNKDIQAVIIATPTHLHKDVAVAALQAGKHVYCEMPLAHTVEDARAIALAAKNAVGRVFQAGLQMRSDPQRHWLMPFIRSGALGKPIMARAQSHKKHSWRSTSPNPDYEKASNWRLNKATSLGLAGEIGIHQIDQAGWLFVNGLPTAVTGFGSINHHKDGRDVADTIHLTVEFPSDVRLAYSCTLASSFDAEHELYYGSEATTLIRDFPTSAWMFKEADAALLGWEVYARRDAFHNETGIALVAGASKQAALGGEGAAASAFPLSPLYYALQSFVTNCQETEDAIENFTDSGFDASDKAALGQFIASTLNREIPSSTDPTPRAKQSALQNIPRHDAGYAATVVAIKANEAVTRGTRIELKKEWLELT